MPRQRQARRCCVNRTNVRMLRYAETTGYIRGSELYGSDFCVVVFVGIEGTRAYVVLK